MLAPLEAEALARSVNLQDAPPVTRQQLEQRQNDSLNNRPMTGRDPNNWWYSKMPPETTDTHRLVLLNIGGLPTKKWYDEWKMVQDEYYKWLNM
jgi:hypothetical protein